MNKKRHNEVADIMDALFALDSRARCVFAPDAADDAAADLLELAGDLLAAYETPTGDIYCRASHPIRLGAARGGNRRLSPTKRRTVGTAQVDRGARRRGVAFLPRSGAAHGICASGSGRRMGAAV